jgi:hypothetical protein
MYGLNPNIPHLAFQFPRLPPSLFSAGHIFANPVMEKFYQDGQTVNKKIEGFTKFYQKHAEGLLGMSQNIPVPPNHPLFSQNTAALKAENEMLLKENFELKKKIHKESKHS